MDQPEKIPTELISIAEYAKRKSRNRLTIYNKLQTPETPDGTIIPEIVDGKWKIDWEKYKDLELAPSPKRRRKSIKSKS